MCTPPWAICIPAGVPINQDEKYCCRKFSKIYKMFFLSWNLIYFCLFNNYNISSKNAFCRILVLLFWQALNRFLTTKKYIKIWEGVKIWERSWARFFKHQHLPFLFASLSLRIILNLSFDLIWNVVDNFIIIILEVF